MEKTIQWYPGHMARAKRIIKEKLKMVDVVIEVLDARAPKASINPELKEIIGVKPLLLILNKADLSDPIQNDLWVKELGKENLTITLDSLMGLKNIDIISNSLDNLLKEKIEKARAVNKNIYPIRAMVVGIPNSGKSTLMNNLAKRRAMEVGNRPGVTKNTTYLKASDKLILLDNPGILWPKFENQDQGKMLALIGSVKEDVVPMDLVCEFGFNKIKELYPSFLKERYGIDEQLNYHDALIEIGKRRGAIKRGGEIDVFKAQDIFLRELRSGKLGRLTFERIS